jgi:hypothetical protein
VCGSEAIVIQLQQGRALRAIAAAAAHLVGSVARTFAGLGTVFLVRK